MSSRKPKPEADSATATVELSKYQRGETRTIERSEIKGAPYNPRTIDDGARKRLLRAIKLDGMIGTLIWNQRTGNLVSGHQRLAILDTLEKGTNYALVVTVIDVDEHKEKALNVQMNNQSMQGEWDVDLLANLALDGVSFDDMGFTEADSHILFGGDSRLADLFNDPEDVAKVKDDLCDIKASRKESGEKMKKAQSADFMLTLVCDDKEQKDALCKLLGVPDYEQFAPGRSVMKKMAGA